MLYFVPQLPVKNRYQSWILKEIIKYTNIPYTIVCKRSRAVRERTNYFTNEKEAVKYELKQVKFLHENVKEGDKVLWMDIDFPGFSVPEMFFIKKRGAKNFGIVHGAYFNMGDVWHGLEERREYMISAINLCEKVFVGSETFRDELISRLNVDQSKIVYTGLPFRLDYMIRKFNRSSKVNIIAIKGLNEVQKRTIEKTFPETFLWEAEDHPYKGFLKLLSVSKAMILWKMTETFGYSLFEALAMKVEVICPSIKTYIEYARKVPMVNVVSSFEEVKERLREIISMDSLERSKRYLETLKFLKFLKESPKRILSVIENA